MPSISVSQQIWEYLHRESERRGGQPISTVLGDLLGLPPSTAASGTPKRTPLKSLREAIVTILGQLGGSATSREVLARLPTVLDLTPDDHAPNHKGQPRWEVQAIQAASQLRREGVLRVSRPGVWALAIAPPNGLGASARPRLMLGE